MRSAINSPGPGDYDLMYNEENQKLIYKLSTRYENSGFGTSSLRFSQKNPDKR